MYWYGPHMGGWGWAFGLGSLIFWVLLAVAVIAVVRYFVISGRRPPSQSHPAAPGPYGQPGPASSQWATAPEQILAERYARGEIDETEFRQRLATLRTSAPSPGAPSPGAQSPGAQSPGAQSPGAPPSPGAAPPAPAAP